MDEALVFVVIVPFVRLLGLNVDYFTLTPPDLVSLIAAACP